MNSLLARRDSGVVEEVRERIKGISCPLRIAKLLDGGPGLRRMVCENVTHLEVPEGWVVDWDFIQHLPHVHTVSGWISCQTKNLHTLSSRIRGDLRVRIGNNTDLTSTSVSSLSSELSMFPCFLSRVRLYPESEVLLLDNQEGALGYESDNSTGNGSLVVTVSLSSDQRHALEKWLQELHLYGRKIGRLVWSQEDGKGLESLNGFGVHTCGLKDRNSVILETCETLQLLDPVSLGTKEQESYRILTANLEDLRKITLRSQEVLPKSPDVYPNVHALRGFLIEWNQISVFHGMFPNLREASLLLIQPWTRNSRARLLTPEKEESLSSPYRETLEGWRKEGRRYIVYYI